MANSWKFMLKKNQLRCFLFDMNFHEYSMNFHKLLYKPFLFFCLIKFVARIMNNYGNFFPISISSKLIVHIIYFSH